MDRDGLRFVIPLVVAGAAMCLTRKTAFLAAGAFLLLAAGYCAYFFRDPERLIPLDEAAILSPGDGRVMEVSQEEEADFLRAPAQVVKIFLSVFDVHINRAPLAGEVVYLKHQPGQFYPAMKPEASRENEQNLIGIEGRANVLVKQIAGAIARRIVCRVRQGQKVSAGERIGLIRFGSQVDIFLPLAADVQVKPGDRVVGGETVIARIEKENN